MRLAICTLLAFCLANVQAADLSVDERLNEAARLEADGDIAAAQEQLTEVVHTITTTDGDFSTRLVEPLITLGRLSLLADELEQAEEYLRRAQHVIHRNEGVHALRQREIVSMLSELHLKRDEPFDADRDQQLLVYLSERNFGKDSPEMLPALDQLADWYIQTGQFYRARKSLERAIEIVEQDGGDRDPRLVQPLIRSAEVRRLQRVCCSYKFLEQARAIVLDNADVPDDERAEVLMALGDAYLASGKDDDAREAYDSAWRLVGDDRASEQFAEPARIAMAKELAEADRNRKRVFEIDNNRFGSSSLRELSPEEILRIESRPPQSFSVPLDDSGPSFHLADVHNDKPGSDRQRRVIGHPFQFDYKQLMNVLPLSWQNDADLARLSVQLDFTVNADGTVSDVEVLGDPPNRVARLMREVLYKTRFRPRIVDGEPVVTENYQLTQTFDR
ncbi:MAG: hypothetical protein ACFHX7_22470 [Pseudomonadota bacterium]